MADTSVLASGAFSIVHVELDPQAHAMRKAPIPAALREQFERIIAAAPATS